MLKTIICLLWGHETFIKIDTVVHEPKPIRGELEVTGDSNAWINLMRGSTVTSLQCPRCCKIKGITL
jgi:hypothetical protein